MKIPKLYPLPNHFFADLGKPIQVSPCLKIFICLDFDSTAAESLEHLPAKVVVAERPELIPAVAFNEFILAELDYHDSLHN